MSRVKVKICCISSIKEAKSAIEAGANAIGLVGQMPSGPGVISEELIGEIVASTPPSTTTFFLTSMASAKEIISIHKKIRSSTIQIVDHLELKEYEMLRSELPGTQLVQVIHVLDENSVQQAITASKYADMILLDSGNPNGKIKELGGTGRTHNWSLSKRIKESIDVPLYLAGGLNPSNIQEAISVVQPFGVDVCSGVRSNGQLDLIKLKAFIDAVKH